MEIKKRIDYIKKAIELASTPAEFDFCEQELKKLEKALLKNNSLFFTYESNNPNCKRLNLKRLIRKSFFDDL